MNLTAKQNLFKIPNLKVSFLSLMVAANLFFIRDVQLLVACCVADILRIFAPEAPYKSADQVTETNSFVI